MQFRIELNPEAGDAQDYVNKITESYPAALVSYTPRFQRPPGESYTDIGVIEIDDADQDAINDLVVQLSIDDIVVGFQAPMGDPE